VARSYYIYYRVQPGNAAELEPRVREMQRALFAATGIHGRLLKKHGEPLLWMEVYENVWEPESFERTLAQIVGQYRLHQFLPPGGKRRTECFGP
jgi:Domain of unknown function (DUF4936)